MGGNLSSAHQNSEIAHGENAELQKEGQKNPKNEFSFHPNQTPLPQPEENPNENDGMKQSNPPENPVQPKFYFFTHYAFAARRPRPT